MIIEIWTWKFSGERRNTYTFWRSIRADYIPKVNEKITFTTKTDKSKVFVIRQIEHEYHNGSLHVQLCVRTSGK